MVVNIEFLLMLSVDGHECLILINVKCGGDIGDEGDIGDGGDMGNGGDMGDGVDMGDRGDMGDEGDKGDGVIGVMGLYW